MKEIAEQGIAKDKSASLGGAAVKYRGIEAAMNKMCVILIHNGISVTPEYSDLTINERAKGDPTEAKATRFATIKGRFRFAASDGSSVDCVTYGEAMDSGDKAVTKAQSVAFRTALFQQFVVPTMAMDPEEGGDGEIDPLPARIAEAQATKTADELRAVSKRIVALFNAERDREGYKTFYAAVQEHGKKFNEVAA